MEHIPSPPSPGATLHGFGWPEGLTLRRRSDDDAQALFDLFSQEDVQRHGFALDPFTSIDEAALFLNARLPGCFETVAILGGVVVGFAGVYPLMGRQSHVGNLILCVDEGCQGRGIGSALLATLISTAWTMIGLHRLQLAVFADNRRAIALYAHFGFAVEGRMACFAKRSDSYVDGLLMAITNSTS